jgi:hypothetical protein
MAGKFMTAIRKGALPPDAFLAKYLGTYTDCYSLQIEQRISQRELVEAFYTTRLFKLERWILARFVGKTSTDLQAKALACGETDRFAAWHVENRNGQQLLLCDFTGRTRSWLMSTADGDEAARTWLYFGSAVVPRLNARSGLPTLGVAFHVLRHFHRLYSRALLRSAGSRLRQLNRAAI